jgi:hypothetical protein
MSIGDSFRQHHDDWIIADITASPRNLAVAIEYDPVGLCIATEPGFSRKVLRHAIGICLALGKFLPGDAPHQPCVATEHLVQPLEESFLECVGGAPSTR